MAVDLEFPVNLDPLTPPVNYYLRTTQRLPSSANPAPEFMRTGTKNASLKRGRAPSLQDLRSEGVFSQPMTSRPRVLPQVDLNLVLPSTIYNPDQRVSVLRLVENQEIDLPSKRSRTRENVDRDGYSRLGS